MDRNFKACLAEVLKHEGGWADHPKDPGGATMKGVTLANFRRYVKSDATKADLRKITDAQIQTVYRRFYWDAVNGAELPDGVDAAVFDFAVNSGPFRAAQFLQEVVGVKVDGKIGPATIAAIRKEFPAEVIHNLCDKRLAFLKRLKTWSTFGKGWSRRVTQVRSFALALSGKPTPEKPSVIKETVTVDKHVVPKQIDKEVRQKAGFSSGLFGAGGTVAGVAAWFNGFDKETLLVVLGVAVVGSIVFLLAGEWIVRRVKSIRSSVET